MDNHSIVKDLSLLFTEAVKLYFTIHLSTFTWWSSGCVQLSWSVYFGAAMRNGMFFFLILLSLTTSIVFAFYRIPPKTLLMDFSVKQIHVASGGWRWAILTDWWPIFSCQTRATRLPRLLPTLPAKFIWSICVAFIFTVAVPVVTTVIKAKGMKGSVHERQKKRKKISGCRKTIKQSWRSWKSDGKWSWSSVSQLMELPSSSGELLVICGDKGPPVERLRNHIVQQALIRQPWPPGVLISIARGSGNPCQSPAGHLITAVAPSSLNPYHNHHHHLPFFLPMSPSSAPYLASPISP